MDYYFHEEGGWWGLFDRGLKNQRFTELEPYEKEDDLGGYKYDFLEDKNVSDEIGFIPHCERPSWGDTIIVDTPVSIFEITSLLLNDHYGKFKGMVHLHNLCKSE